MDEVDATREAVEALLAAQQASLPSCPDAVVSSAVCSLARSASQLGAARTAVVGEWATRGLAALDGSRPAAARFARDTGCSTAFAAHLLRRAARLRTMAVTAEAFARGDLSADKVDMLCRANSDGREALFARDQHHLVSEAKRLHAEDLRRAVAYWIAAADDARAEKAADKQAGSRTFHASRTSGDMWDLRGRLDSISGTVFFNELEAIARQLFFEDWAAAKKIWGEDTRPDRLARTNGQRRADAVVLMAERSAAVAVGHVPARPLITLHLGEDAARKALCELDDGTVITPGQARQWMADADFERVVFGAKSRVIDLGVRTRLFRGGLRRIIEIRDRHCTYPGCRVAAHRCDVDHITEYSAGGQTTQDNGRLLCPFHNQQRPGRNQLAGREPPDDPEER